MAKILKVMKASNGYIVVEQSEEMFKNDVKHVASTPYDVAQLVDKLLG